MMIWKHDLSRQQVASTRSNRRRARRVPGITAYLRHSFFNRLPDSVAGLLACSPIMPKVRSQAGTRLLATDKSPGTSP
jgi:hypothetical protein